MTQEELIKHIEELDYAGVKVMPVKVVGTDIYHIDEYRSKFDTGLTIDEHRHWAAKGYNGLAVFMSKCNPELVNLDVDEKHNQGEPILPRLKEMVDPAVWAELAIERTRSGGYHIYFLVRKKYDVHALAANSDGREMIALRGGNFEGITYCAPTRGYEFTQKSLSELSYLEDEAVTQLLDAARSLNTFTGRMIAHSGGLKKYAASRFPEPPMNYAGAMKAFDDNVDAMFIPEHLQGLGWSMKAGTMNNPRAVDKEHGRYYELYRPGKAQEEKKARSACYYVEKKRISVYTDDVGVKLPSINNGRNLSSWLSPHMVLYYLNDENWDATYQQVIELSRSKEIALPERISMVHIVETRRGLSYSVQHAGVQEWAISMGYRYMRMSAEDDAPQRLIRVVDNIIYAVDDNDIVRNYSEEIKRNYPEQDAQRVLVKFIPSLMSYMTVLPLFDGTVLRDTMDSSFMYFNNGILEIKKNGTQLHRYQDIEGHVFASDIKPYDYTEVPSDGEFKRFMQLTSIDENSMRHTMQAIGYLLHTYKRKSYAKAVMIIEDVEDQDEARGRSGKGIIGQFVKFIRPTVEQDGRNFKSESQFKMQRIGFNTVIFYFNDPPPGLPYSQFYNNITDDFQIELKGKKSYSIPYKLSPKMLITTNYLPPLESDSDKDRFIVVAIKKVFTASYRFADEFTGPDFFSDEWGKKETMATFAFAVECIQMFLHNGKVADIDNTEIKRKQDRRLIGSNVPEYLVEVLENIIEAGQSSKLEHNFIDNLRPFDAAQGRIYSLLECAKFKGESLVIYSSLLLQYVKEVYKQKITDKSLGKKIKFYFDKMDIKYERERFEKGRGFKVLVPAMSARHVAPSGTQHGEKSAMTWQEMAGKAGLEPTDDPF